MMQLNDEAPCLKSLTVRRTEQNALLKHQAGLAFSYQFLFRQGLIGCILMLTDDKKSVFIVDAPPEVLHTKIAIGDP